MGEGLGVYIDMGIRDAGKPVEGGGREARWGKEKRKIRKAVMCLVRVILSDGREVCQLRSNCTQAD